MLAGYFNGSNPLAIAHAVIGLAAAVVFVFWHREVRGLKRTAGRARAISEQEYRQAAAKVEKFDPPFDFLASALILVGLVGTIRGFIAAIPHLKDSTYDFSDFSAALMVSAMGIVWSIALHAVLAIYRIVWVVSALESLQSRQDQRELAKLLASSLSDVTTRISENLGVSLTNFVTATNDLKHGTLELATNATRASEAFVAASRDAQKSIQESVKIYSLVRELPVSTYEQIKTAMNDHRAEMSGLFKEQRQEWHKVSEAVQLTTDAHFTEMHRTYVAQLEKDVEAARTASADSVKAITHWALAFSQSLSQMQKDVPEVIHRAHHDALQKVALTAQTLASAGERQAEVTKRMATSVGDFHDAVKILAATAKSLPAALVQGNQAQLSDLERKLDAVVVAVRGPGDRPWSPRRWWPSRGGGLS